MIGRGIPQEPREDGVRIVSTRWGLRHAFPQGGGGYVTCRGNPATCIRCKEDGTPQMEPDVFDVTAGLLLKYGKEFWYHSHRRSLTRAEKDGGDISLAEGLYIYVRVGGETIVIANFGDHDELDLVVSAICYQHNRALGFEL